ncbi:MAG: ECF transporter S component [Ruminococcus sp.]|nr:ECF transporter S component [Ruminococcus sp.]
MIVIRSKAARDVLRCVIPFLLIPAVVLLGAAVFSEKRHAFVSLAVAGLSVVLFLTGFERQKTGSRRLVIVSVMTALAVVGRFIPVLKPVAAVTIMTAIYLGGESGFLVGAMTALISNFYFGQGPWTPFQMLAWGLIGLFAGLLADPLRRNRVLLLVYGVVSGIFYSMTMDIWTVMWYGGGFDPQLYKSAIIAAIPHTTAYVVSNVVFLALMADPFGEKLDRLRVKYGV